MTNPSTATCCEAQVAQPRPIGVRWIIIGNVLNMHTQKIYIQFRCAPVPVAVRSPQFEPQGMKFEPQSVKFEPQGCLAPRKPDVAQVL